MSKNQVDDLLERAASQIRSAEPDPKMVAASAARVWSRFSSSGAEAAASAAEVGEIRGCDDYQALIPAYLAGSLPEARKLLLEEHSRECVPCHRALKEAREGKATPRPRPREKARVMSFPRPLARLALAAALLAGIGVTLYFVSGLVLYGGTSAVVQTADGELFKVTPEAHLPLAAGDVIREGEAIRSGRSGAVIRLEDGSLVEMRQRSEVAIDESRRGTTIELARGDIIVEAAKQRSRHLYVATENCLVSVTGTIFGVNAGLRGDRVSVVEGNVDVEYDGKKARLLPGDQVTTQDYLAAIPVEDEIDWSRNADRYIELLREFADLRREIQERVQPPGLRYASRLLDLVPEDTVFYAAVPNLGETVTETHAVIREKVDASPVLQEWWAAKDASGMFKTLADDIVGKIGELSEYLGDEIAVTGQMTFVEHDFNGPLVLAEVKSAAGLRTFIEELEAELEEMLAEEGHDGPGNVFFVDDPSAPVPEAGLYVWLSDDVVAISPQAALVAHVAELAAGAPNPFVGTDFYRQIAALYEEGAEILVAVDFEEAIRTAVEQGAAAQAGSEGFDTFARLGMLNAQHLIFEQKHTDKTYYRAALTFKEARHGVASWLAEPAPMGALRFISPKAKLVAAFVIEDPVDLLDDIASLTPESGVELAEAIAEVEARFGFNLRDDLAASLGGEFAFAIDGPMVPVPSWKLVVEVYDPARLQWTLEQSLAEVNVLLAQEGKDPIEITSEEVGGRTFYSVPAELFTVHYTYVDGYLLAAPSRELLRESLSFQKSGFSITAAEGFRKLLPKDGHNNFSAMVYQDLAPLFQDLLEVGGQMALTDEQRQALDEILAGREPTLGYAYGTSDRIVFAAASETDMMLSLFETMAGLESPLALGGLSELGLENLPLGGNI